MVKNDISEKSTVVVFEKPYEFEGKIHNEIDLKNLENITANDMIKVERIFAIGGNAAAITEMSMAYVCILAGTATNTPKEFFEGLPAKEALKVKALVTNFLFRKA